MKGENKDFIDFFSAAQRLCARYFFLPQRRRAAEDFLYFHIKQKRTGHDAGLIPVQTVSYFPVRLCEMA